MPSLHQALAKTAKAEDGYHVIPGKLALTAPAHISTADQLHLFFVYFHHKKLIFINLYDTFLGVIKKWTSK